MRWEIAGGVIETVHGDLALARADAIVNAANTDLWMGAGVAGALKLTGGSEIERDAMAQAPIRLGDAIVTRAGRLAARWVIHAAGMEPGGIATAQSVRLATRNALARSTQFGAASIAFPAIGTGVGRFPVDQAATIMVGEVLAHLRAERQPTSVLFVFRDVGPDSALAAFDAAVARAARDPGAGPG